MNLSNETQYHLKINRPIYNIAQFEKEFSSHYKKQKKSTLSKVAKHLIATYNPKKILSIFTIVNLLSEYKYKEYLVSDIISGLTVGVLHIPTSLAYGAVTSLNLVHGLYTTFFPSLVYALFATSKHLSVGTFAILSIMVYSTIARLESKYMDVAVDDYESVGGYFKNETSNLNQTLIHSSMLDVKRQAIKLMIATSLSFWCGIVKVSK